MKKKILVISLIVILIPVIIYFFFPGLLIDQLMTLERKNAGFTVKSVEVQDHKIVYMDGGEGKAILLVHGYTANKDNWTRFAKPLIPDYYVVAVDLPGFGDSSRIETETYSIKNQVKRLNEFCKAINIDKFHIVGSSMGGSIAGCYTIAYPKKVLSLALFNTGGVPSSNKSDFHKLFKKGINLFEIKTSKDFDKMLGYVFVKPPPMPGFMKDFFMEEALKNKAFNEKIGKDLNKEKYSLEPYLKRIKTKTLVLWGDTDKFIHVSAVKILSNGLPNCKAVIMKDCGHIPMVERPEETANHYINFLSEVTSGKI